MARKSAYLNKIKPRLADIVAWVRDGATVASMCKRLGIGESTWFTSVKRFPTFSQAIDRAKGDANAEVVNALFMRAIGFEYDETTRESCLNPETNKFELQVTKVVTKRVAPDVSAIQFWLTNRDSAKWKQRIDNTLNASISTRIILPDDLAAEDAEKVKFTP